VLEALLSDVVESEVETPGYVLLYTGRHANASGLGETFQPSRDIHAVTEDVVVLHNDVALVNADSKLDAIVARYSGISLTHRVLPLGRTAQCIDNTGKFDQQAIASRFDDASTTFADLRIDHVGADRTYPAKSTFLVRPNQPRIPRHIGGEDRGETPGRSHLSGKPMRRKPSFRVLSRSAQYVLLLAEGK
jgi:hypothetical protein